MSEPPENYVPQALGAAYRRQAWRVWIIASAIVFVWAALIVVAPAAKLVGVEAISSPLLAFYEFICHRIPDRSFHIAGEQFGVCSRCFGVYLGLFIGFAVYPLWRRVEEVEPIARFWLFLSIIPIAIDWSLTVFGIWENTQASRFLTGLILGIACATFIVPALVEASRNLTKPRIATG